VCIYYTNVERPTWHNGYWYKTKALVKEYKDDNTLSNEEIQQTIVQILEQKVEDKK